MEEAGASVALTDVHEALAYFAEAIAGQPVQVDAVEPGECWPWVPVRPGNQQVVVPASIDWYRDIESNRTAYRATTLRQVLGMTNGPLPAIPKGIRRDVYSKVLALVEDMRLNEATLRIYPGAAPGLHRALRIARDAISHEPPLDLIDVLRRRSLDEPPANCVSAASAAGVPGVEQLMAAVAGVDGPDASLETSVAAAIRVCHLIRALAASGPTEWVGVEEPVAEEDSVMIGADPTGGALDSAGSPTDYESSEGLDGGQVASELGEQSRAVAEGEPRPPSGGLSFERSAGGLVLADVRTFVYDEWDFRARRHRPSWCRILEERLSGDDNRFIGEVRSRHIGLRSQIRRSFATLRPSGLVRVYRSDDGEEVDMDAAIEAIVDRRGGAPTQDRLDIRRDRATRDVATAFLVDLSASTSSPATPPDASLPVEYDPEDDVLSYAPIWGTANESEPERRVIDVAKDAVALMSDALHELGDQHAIFGFSGTGRNNVEFKIAKDFDDRVSPTTWSALAAMKPRHYTRMGAAVRHATAKLAKQPARTKLLLVISDGYPQDTDYGDDRRDRDYGLHDTARALADAALANIDTFCLTIDPAGHDYLRVMCPDHRYLVIEDVEALPEALATVYLTLSIH